MTDPIQAHSHSRDNRAEIRLSESCGCFYCLAIFHPSQVVEHWHDTAVCPACGIDSLIGSASGYPITAEFLSEMNIKWFGV